MDRVLTRRALLGAALPLFATPLLPGRVAGLAWLAPRERLRVGLLLPEAAPSDDAADAIVHGLALGAEESRHTAALFGVDLEVAEWRVRRDEDTTLIARDL